MVESISEHNGACIKVNNSNAMDMLWQKKRWMIRQKKKNKKKARTPTEQACFQSGRSVQNHNGKKKKTGTKKNERERHPSYKHTHATRHATKPPSSTLSLSVSLSALESDSLFCSSGWRGVGGASISSRSSPSSSAR